ncbi:hypothetical protein VTI28DRAFT_2297 [Corynascus sepedonium]
MPSSAASFESEESCDTLLQRASNLPTGCTSRVLFPTVFPAWSGPQKQDNESCSHKESKGSKGSKRFKLTRPTITILQLHTPTTRALLKSLNFAPSAGSTVG